MGLHRAVLLALAGLLGLVSPVAAQGNCPAGPNVAGIVVGCILGTLAVVGIVIGIILLIKHKKNQPKKAKAATKTGDAGLEQAHVNPAFQDDSPTAAKPTEKANDVSFAEQGFGGYVPCKEFEHTPKKEEVRAPPRSNGNLARVSGLLPTHGAFGAKLTKSGSHGSLDDSYPSLAVHSSAIELSKMHSMDPEVINVALQSQDIIGLGFNICGNLRDGIFVSQVHNRGPASESRLIKPGDRILGITISFENMVYEDALTILSYASPYPVQLQVQKKPLKASDPDVTGDDYEEAQHLHHPIYRSQSMDDVSKIAQDSVFRVRRARSEMKRGSSKRKPEEDEVVVVEEGRLRKWSGKPDFGEPVVPLSDEASDEKSENSTVSIPDLRIDATDLMASYSSNKGELTEATVHHELEAVPSLSLADGLALEEVSLDEVRLDQTEAPTLGLSPKRQAELDRKEGLRLSYEADRPVRKLDLEEPELNVETTTKADDETDGSLTLKVDSMETEVESSLGAGPSLTRPEWPSRSRSPSPVIISGDMATGLRIGSSSDPPLDTSLTLVPDVGQEVAVTSQTPEDAFAVVTEHDGFIDIDLKNTPTEDPAPSAGSSSPPPSPPPGPPPPLSDSAADVTESSMHVLLSEESILKRDEPDAQEEEAGGEPSQSDASVRAVLKDYFSDQPSLMERLGLTRPDALQAAPPREGEPDDVKLLTPRLGAASPTAEDKASGEADAREIRARNGKALNEAKMVIRRRSSSSEEELPHASSPSTLSSRSSSPVEPPPEDAPEEGAVSGGEPDKESSAGEAPRERANRKSHSPLVKKRSSGGLMYDISPTEFQEMAVDVPGADGGTDRLNLPAGVAYYVSIDDKFHGAPLTQRAETDDCTHEDDEEEEEEEKPSLVKAWGLPNMSSAPRYGMDGDDEASTTRQVTEVVTIDGPGSRVTETRTSTVTMTNNNNDFGMNGKGGRSPLTTPLKARDVLTTEVSKSNEVITVTRHEEIQGAYTLTVNTASHNEDSEA